MTGLWEKALDAAKGAHVLLKADDCDGAANRAYYAMFNAAREMLSQRHGIDPESIKTHATVLRLFSMHFVEAGLFERELGRVLHRASDIRIVADYDVIQVSPNEARRVVEAMDVFISKAAELLGKEQSR